MLELKDDFRDASCARREDAAVPEVMTGPKFSEPVRALRAARGRRRGGLSVLAVVVVSSWCSAVMLLVFTGRDAEIIEIYKSYVRRGASADYSRGQKGLLGLLVYRSVAKPWNVLDHSDENQRIPRHRRGTKSTRPKLFQHQVNLTTVTSCTG